MVKKVADFLDTLLQICKWPIAVFAAAGTVPVMLAFLSLIPRIYTTKNFLFWQIVAGGGAYLGVWWVLLRHTRISYFTTLEHELTHALFAFLTFHPITGIRSSLRGGGQMTFLGKGNWIITLAPYFFPTVTVVTTVFLMAAPEKFADKAALIFGASVGHHVVSTYRETHRHQSDFRKAGLLFTVVILPVSFVLLLGVCVSCYVSGWTGITEFGELIWQRANSIFCTVRSRTTG